MKQKWKKVQAVEITIDEIFCLQDRLDDVRDDPIKVWEVFDDFLATCESQLELSPTFLKQLHEVDIEKDFKPLSVEEIDELFDDYGKASCNVAEDYVNYVLYVKDSKSKDLKFEIPSDSRHKDGIPFTPRHDF